MKGRSYLLVGLLAASVVASQLGGCSTFGDADPAPAGADGGDGEGGGNGGDAAIDARPTAACVPEPEWAGGDGGAEHIATCGGRAGVDLLASSTDCGRCGHACDNDDCTDGRCQTKLETKLTQEATILGTIGSDLYFREGYSILKSLPPTGPAVSLGNIPPFDAADPEGYKLILGGVAGAPGNVFVRTRAFVFHLAGTALVPVAEVPDNDEPSHFAVNDEGIYVSSKLEILRIPIGADAGTVLQSAPHSIYVVAHGPSIFWLEQPWNAHAQGDTASKGPTVLERHTGGSAALVRSDPKQLTALYAAPDALYFMQLGAGGGIFSLPYDATSATPPVRVASDDALSEETAFLVTDDAYVYWTRPQADDDHYSEIWKRAKCGGAQIRVGSIIFLRGLAARGDRLYAASDTSIVSLAK